MTDKWTYCNYDGTAAVYLRGSGGIAWWWIDGEWKPANGPDVFTKARVVTKEEFDRMFGKLPPPPED